MEVSTFFVEKCSADDLIHSTTGFLDAPKRVPGEGVNDYYAVKYVNKVVYVWKGPLKTKVGRVISIGGLFARLSITGAIAGSSVQSVKREHLIR